MDKIDRGGVGKASVAALASVVLLVGCAAGGEEEVDPLAGVTDPPVSASDGPSASGTDGAGGTSGAAVDGSDSGVKVPVWTTDLDLDAEEIVQVEKALITLAEYVQFSNDAYKTGNYSASKALGIMTDNHWSEIEPKINEVVSQGITLSGELEERNPHVVAGDRLTSSDGKLEVHVCTNLTEIKFNNPDGSQADSNPATEDSVTIYDFERDVNKWKVAHRGFEGSTCDQ